MNKKYLGLPLSAVIGLGLSGCGYNNETAVEDRYNDAAQPMGYYSNENHKGNATIINDNDGPVTEMMDHTVGNERSTNPLRVGNRENPTSPLANTDRNFFQRDNRFPTSDVNYHGHIKDQTPRTKSSYYTGYKGNLVEQIDQVTESVPNVKEARSVIHGDRVTIAVKLTDQSKEVETKQNILKTVNPYVQGKSVTVSTSAGSFGKIRSIDNDLRNGGPKNGVTGDLKNIFKNIKNRVTDNYYR